MKTTTTERLAQAMKMRKINASQLSEKTGISRSSISRYLSGNYDPGKENFFKIAGALNVNPNWLAGEDVYRVDGHAETKHSDFWDKYIGGQYE